MDLKIYVNIFSDEPEGSKLIKDADGKDLELSVEVKGAEDPTIYSSDMLNSLFVPAVGALCRHYGVKGTVQALAFVHYLYDDKGSCVEHIERRIDLSNLKVLMDRECLNCGRNLRQNELCKEECHWQPLDGHIEETDDEARCSVCGYLVYSDTKSCPNCCAVFKR